MPCCSFRRFMKVWRKHAAQMLQACAVGPIKSDLHRTLRSAVSASCACAGSGTVKRDLHRNLCVAVSASCACAGSGNVKSDVHGNLRVAVSASCACAGSGSSHLAESARPARDHPALAAEAARGRREHLVLAEDPQAHGSLAALLSSPYRRTALASEGYKSRACATGGTPHSSSCNDAKHLLLAEGRPSEQLLQQSTSSANLGL